MSELLRSEKLGKTYTAGPLPVEVFRGLDFAVARGERIAVVGASGVGKSTLLHLLGGLDRPTSGEIWFDGEPLSAKNERELARFRNRSVGFVFQFHYLLPEFTALENVAMALWIRGRGKGKAIPPAADWLAKVGLSHRLRHRPAELSGGEQQRVAIARALVTEPDLLLADEPTGNLDMETSRAVMGQLFSLTRGGKRGLVIATHNPEIAALADRVLRMKEGRWADESERA